jgi:hypothetical protein
MYGHAVLELRYSVGRLGLGKIVGTDKYPPRSSVFVSPSTYNSRAHASSPPYYTSLTTLQASALIFLAFVFSSRVYSGFNIACIPLLLPT